MGHVDMGRVDSVFIFFLQKGRTWCFSVCPLYVRVKPLYTPRCKPAESVTVDFFMGHFHG